MQQIPWNMSHIKQCEQITGQAMLRDEHSLVSFSEDFGRTLQSRPSAVCVPQTDVILQKIIRYANENNLPLTIRGNGMSQCGQSISPPGGLVVHLGELNSVCSQDEESVWVEANTSWASLLASSLKENKVPPVVPYNCDLSVAGVISAGGLGASSFKFGSVTAHVSVLEVITADGVLQRVDASSPLFHACLGGQGRFGVISKACIKLRPCGQNVRTFFMTYLDKQECLNDLKLFKENADYIEFFCSPSIQGAKLSPKGRLPFAQWLYVLHVSVEYDDKAPDLQDLNPDANPWKMHHVQDETIASYVHRHDSRFQAMKMSGQWELQHVWYECFVSADVLMPALEELLASLPLHYATVVQLASIKNLNTPGFFMLPDSEEIFAVMILNPGLPKPLVPSCMDAIKALDVRFLSQGGKRYLSGFLGFDLKPDYWKSHFNRHYEDWITLKQQYDPKRTFCSALHYLE